METSTFLDHFLLYPLLMKHSSLSVVSDNFKSFGWLMRISLVILLVLSLVRISQTFTVTMSMLQSAQGTQTGTET